MITDEQMDRLRISVENDMEIAELRRKLGERSKTILDLLRTLNDAKSLFKAIYDQPGDDGDLGIAIRGIELIDSATKEVR